MLKTWNRQILLSLAWGLTCLAWLLYFASIAPTVSRGDFLLAIARLAAAVESGDWLYASTWPLHILGGHIIFYERAAQLLNYYVFDYSPLFVKASAIAAWTLLAIGIHRVVTGNVAGRREQAACLLFIAVATFNPVAWEVLAWPDANVPYLSSLVVLLFLAQPMIGCIVEGQGPRALARLAGMCVLVIIGSGVGWAIVPAVLVLQFTAAVQRRQFRAVVPVAVLLCALVAGAVAAIVFFHRTLRLGLLTESVAGLPENLPALAGYFLCLFGALLGRGDRPAALYAGAAVFSACMAIYLLYKWRRRSPAVAEMLFLFGMGSLVLVALGRWKLNMERGDATLPTYYHLFALPVFYGAVLMVADMMRPRLAWVAICAASAVVAAFLALKVPALHTNFLAQSRSYAQMLRAAQGWRMSEATRLIGWQGHNQAIYFEHLPLLRRHGKYRALTADFQPYASSRMTALRPSENRRSCSDRYRNLEVIEAGADQRAEYTPNYDQRPFFRVVGTARNPSNCDATDVAVSLVRQDGVVLCRSWTNDFTHWHFRSEQHREIVESPYAFDFSCPAAAGEYFLVSQDASGRRLETVGIVR